LSIRVPKDAAAKLRAAHKRTGRSYSDIGEALVVWHGPTATFPAPLKRLTARQKVAARRAPAPTRGRRAVA
jgi:hypothetical protein